MDSPLHREVPILWPRLRKITAYRRVYFVIFTDQQMMQAKHWIVACAVALSASWSALAQTISSPNKGLKLHFSMSAEGAPMYRLSFADGQEIIRPSHLGLEMTDAKKSFDKGLEVTGTKESTFDETWKPVWGEVKEIRNHYNELLVNLKKTSNGDPIAIRFRLFDD